MVQVRINGHFYRQLAIIYEIAEHPSVRLAPKSNCRGASRSTQVSHKDLAATISGMDSPGRLGVQDSDQAQAAGRFNYDQAAERSFYAPKKNGGGPP